jgi:hypothetical protein
MYTGLWVTEITNPDLVVQFSAQNIVLSITINGLSLSHFPASLVVQLYIPVSTRHVRKACRRLKDKTLMASLVSGSGYFTPGERNPLCPLEVRLGRLQEMF